MKYGQNMQLHVVQRIEAWVREENVSGTQTLHDAGVPAELISSVQYGPFFVRGNRTCLNLCVESCSSKVTAAVRVPLVTPESYRAWCRRTDREPIDPNHLMQYTDRAVIATVRRALRKSEQLVIEQLTRLSAEGLC